MKAADHRAVRDRVHPPQQGQREYALTSRCCRAAQPIAPGERYYVACVCMYIEYCPTHHRVVHVGTHD